MFDSTFESFISDQSVSRKPSNVSLGDALDGPEDPQVLVPGALWSSPGPLSAVYTPDTSLSEGSYFSSVLSSSSSFYSPDSDSTISPPLSATDDPLVYHWAVDSGMMPNMPSLHTMAHLSAVSPADTSAAALAAVAAAAEAAAVNSSSLTLSPGMAHHALEYGPALASHQFGAAFEITMPPMDTHGPSPFVLSPSSSAESLRSLLPAAEPGMATTNSSWSPTEVGQLYPAAPDTPPEEDARSKIAFTNLAQTSLGSPDSLSPTPSPVSIRDRTELIKQRTSYTKWVKLSRMTDQRIGRIKGLAADKGIDVETVESVLKLYSDTSDKQDNDVNRFEGEDVYIKITMGSGAFVAEDEEKADSKKKKHRKQNPHYVKRPLNSFMLYRKSQTQSAMAYAMSSQLKLNHQNISQIIGLMWQTESKELKEEFARFAFQEKELHKMLHPDYKFCPQKRKRATPV